MKDKKFSALYLNTEGTFGDNQSRYLTRTLDDFHEYVTGSKDQKCSTECLNNGLLMLYKLHSEDSLNRIVSKYVNDHNVHGPVIIYNSNKTDIDKNTHEQLENVFEGLVWIGFDFNLDDLD